MGLGGGGAGSGCGGGTGRAAQRRRLRVRRRFFRVGCEGRHHGASADASHATWCERDGENGAVGAARCGAAAVAEAGVTVTRERMRLHGRGFCAAGGQMDYGAPDAAHGEAWCTAADAWGATAADGGGHSGATGAAGHCGNGRSQRARGRLNRGGGVMAHGASIGDVETTKEAREHCAPSEGARLGR